MAGHDLITDRRASKKDRLIAYLKSGVEDPEMEQMWDQCEFIERHLRSMKKSNVAIVVSKKYNCSRSHAYKLIREVEEFSGFAHAPNKEYLVFVQVERLQRDIETASMLKDFKAVSALSKELRLWIHNPNELDLSIMEKLQLHQFNIQININGEEADVPLESFYKLSEQEKKKMIKAQSQEFVPWEEMESMINNEES